MNDLTKRRLQLLALGYHILPTYGKIAKLKGWNRPEFVARELDPERIEQWPLIYKKLKSTGVRIENGLRAVDIDVDDGPMVEALLAYVATIAPDVAAHAPTRYGGGAHKLTLFVRAPAGDEVFAYLSSHKYLRPNDPDDEDHKVELFGGGPAHNGNCARHCGIYGPHSYNEDGTVAAEYIWAEGVPALHQVKATDLPELSKVQMLAIAGEFERLAEAAGWTRVERPDVGSANAVYDINDQSRFDTDKGDKKIDYAALCEAQVAYGDLRCSSSFMGGEGKRKDRCWVYWSKRHDCVAVYEYGAAVSHYPAEFAPKLDLILDALKSIKKGSIVSARPNDDAKLKDKAQWLIENYGYCALNDSIVELFKPADDCQLKPLAFQRLYRAWREVQATGPRGGNKFITAAGYWEVSPTRIDIEGVRMRPDRSFPLYEDHGRSFKNTYQRPQHTTEAGDIGPWLKFMHHLLPDETERTWFCNWLAHKYAHPGVPGVAVIMVAATDDGPVYGAGRGILRDILARLLGVKYVKPLDFDVFTGQSSQSVYTDWAAYSILITVSEAKDTSDSGKWASRRAVYERLKEIVDPRAVERTFSVKGRAAFTAMSFASYLIFSNHRDAVQVQANDRRVTALANGGQMSAAMAEQLGNWMEVEANIAELARWLEKRDLVGFNVYEPLLTATKTTMQELAGTEFDEAFASVRKAIGPRGLFTAQQLEAYMLMELNDNSDMAKRQVKRMVKQASKRVGDFRLPPTEGRYWVLCWRDHNPVQITTAAMAQGGVHSSRKSLSDFREDSRGQILEFTKPKK